MHVKFGRDKTAVLLTSMIVRKDRPEMQVDGDGDYFLPVVDAVDGTEHELPVVSAYKHLGGILTSNCSPQPDLFYRYSRAAGIVKPLSRKLFSSHRFDIAVRRTLLRALTVSRYVHTSAALILKAAVHQRVWDRHFVALWRHLSTRTSAEKQDHPYRVLHLARAPSPPLALAKTRAAFLKKLFAHGPSALRALLHDHWADHAPSSWFSQLQADVLYVKQYLPSIGDLLPAGFEVTSLLEAVADSPDWWLKQVRVAEKRFFQDLQRWLAEPSVRSPPQEVEPRPLVCDVCQCAFVLRKHLHAHQARAHRRFSPARHYTLTEYCLSCHRHYGSIQQSQQHLKASSRCLVRLAHVFPPLT